MEVNGLEILGIEFPNACKSGELIVRKRRRGRGSYSSKHPVLRIQNKSLRRFVFLSLLFREEGIRPASIDFSLLQEVIVKKTGVSKPTAYGIARAMYSLDQ